MKEQVLVLSFSFEQTQAAFDVLTNAGYTPVVWRAADHGALTEGDLIRFWDALPEKPVGMVMGADVTIGPWFLQAAGTLRAISLNCAGYDHVSTDACKAAGVGLTHVPSRNFNAVADFAFGQMLSLMRNVTAGNESIRKGLWCKGVERSQAFSEKTLGIVGMGAIGQAVAKRAVGFDMKLIALSTSKKPELAERYGLTFADGKAFYETADIIVLCCPHNSETHHMINAETLSYMKRTAVLINPARGGLVDTDALIDALKNRRIAGAALDAYETEPLLQSPLFDLEHVLLTPHIGGLADREIDDVATRSAVNLCDMLRGGSNGNTLVEMGERRQ